MARMIRRGNSLFGLLLFAASLAAVGLSGCAKSTESGKTSSDKAAGQSKTGRQVMEAMADVYRKAKTYQDFGSVRVIIQSRDQKPIDEMHDFGVAFERPNKLAMDVYRAKVRCDGKKFHAFLENLPGQVLERDAPEKMEIKTIVFDNLLVQQLCNGPARAAPQPILLMEQDALKYLLTGAEEPTLGEPGEIDGHPCYRVQVRDSYGVATYWIDRDNFILRRIVLPSEALRAEFEQGSGTQAESISVVADFKNAAIDRPVDPKAFAFEMPDKSFKLVKFFTPPHPGQWMGQKSPDFTFVDVNGKTISPKTLAGKTAAVVLWSGRFPGAEQTLLDLQKLADQYKSVAICVVCADGGANPKDVEKYCRSLKVTMPIYGCPADAENELRTNDLPKIAYLIGPDGMMQDYECDENAILSKVLPPKIDRLLAGENLHEAAAERYRGEMEQYEKQLEERNKEGQPVQEAKIAEPTPPKAFKLKPLWKCDELKDAGNILAIDGPQGPRFLVVCPPGTVAEVGADGKVIARHKLDLADGELVANLRTFADSSGKTYVAAFAGGQQRLHVFDLDGKLRMSYPEDALTNPHSGVADVELCDLDGDGKPEIYVGFWGVVGVHAVGLDGKRLWVNRSLANVARMAAGPVEDSGRRSLLCANFLSLENSALAVLDPQGQSQGEIAIANRSPLTFLSGDLSGDGNPLWCALGVSKENEKMALGFDLQGKELWNFALPNEQPTRPIEMIIAGNISPSGPGQWFVPLPDGSIQILAIDGKPIDRFNTGVILQGFATATIGGKPALLIASPNGLEAFSIE
jgi:hypothetical protein